MWIKKSTVKEDVFFRKHKHKSKKRRRSRERKRIGKKKQQKKLPNEINVFAL